MHRENNVIVARGSRSVPFGRALPFLARDADNLQFLMGQSPMLREFGAVAQHGELTAEWLDPKCRVRIQVGAGRVQRPHHWN